MKNVFKLGMLLVAGTLALAGCGNAAADMKENFDSIVKNYGEKGYVYTNEDDGFKSELDYSSASEFTSMTEFDGQKEVYTCSEKNGNSLKVNGVIVETSDEDFEDFFGDEGGLGEEFDVEVDESEVVEGEPTTEEYTLGEGGEVGGGVSEGETYYFPADMFCEASYELESVEFLFEEIEDGKYFAEDSKFEVEEDGDYHVIKDGKKELRVKKDGKELIFKDEGFTSTLKLK